MAAMDVVSLIEQLLQSFLRLISSAIVNNDLCALKWL